MAASGAPPLFCLKKPTTNLQMTCFTNESRIALGQGISFSAARSGMHQTETDTQSDTSFSLKSRGWYHFIGLDMLFGEVG